MNSFAFHRAALAALCLLFCSGSVLADQASDEPSGGGSGDDELTLEHVTVTGTRLQMGAVDGVYPLTTIGAQELQDSGYENVGEYLQQLPFMAGSPLGTTTSMRGEGGGLSRGISTVELRGLGAERTLVLVNGRRFIAGGNGASGLVDINMIPMAIIERVEILRSGASVEYGADAVAGVVNIITRKETRGIELQAQGDVTSRGDAETYSLSATYGKAMERGEFLVAATWTDQPALGKGERDWSSQRLGVTGPDNTIIPSGSSAPPDGNFRTSLGRLTLIDGEDGNSVDDFRPFTDADRFNFNPLEDLLQASERTSLFAQGEFDINENLSVFGEALYQQRDSSQTLAPLPFFSNRETDVSVSADNIYNPFGEELDDVRRRLVEAGQRSFAQDNTAWRGVLGLKGQVADWLWDVSAIHGRNETDQVQSGDLLDSRLRLALGPSFLDASGNAVCGTPEAPIEGCVPLNVFGGAGSITPEMLAYVGTGLNDSGYNEQTVFNANFSGLGPDLFAGPMGMAFGYEYRDESAADFPDPQTVLGNTTGSARTVTQGSFDSNEVYAEVGIPLLQDRAMAQELDLDLGVRWVNFSDFDAEWLYEIGLHHKPTDSLHLRATYSSAFRAPNVRELFGGFSQSNPIVQDPCADFSQLSPVEVDRCVAQGVPPDGSFNQNGEETPVLSGGNPDLGPELSDSFSIGFTYLPAGLPGFELNLDYYDIKIDSGIFALGANTILEQCLATGDPDFCGRIDRDASGAINRVNAQLQNLATETARGVDAEMLYSYDALGGGFDHGLRISYVAERDLVAFPGAESFVGAGSYDPDNFGAIPRWRSSYSLVYNRGDLRLGYEAQYIGSLEESGGELYPGTVNDISSRLYHDLFAGYTFNKHLEATLGIDNVTDEDPPFFANADEANTDVATYQVLGRVYWLRLNFWLQ